MQASRARFAARGLLRLGSGAERGSDLLFRWAVTALGIGLIVLLILLVEGLGSAAWLSIRTFGPAFLWSSEWDPVQHHFGALPAIWGTLATSGLALLIAGPVGIGAAIFLAELAPRWLERPLSFLIELLAAIPSVVVGLWGLFVMVPWLRGMEVLLRKLFGNFVLFSGPPIGIGLLGAGVLLAIMILPILTAIVRDVLRAVPGTQREAMLALGATEWETVTRAVLPYGRSGIVGGAILALGRALGETMAVTMVAGNNYQIVPSLFAPLSSVASVIAGQFSEADSQLYVSALLELGLVLFVITVIVNVLARLLVWRVSGQSSVGVAGEAEMAVAQAQVRRISPRRRLTNTVLLGLCGLAGLGSAAILLVLLGFVLVNGIRYVRPAFLLELPTPMGVPGGGIAHALAGSALMVGLGCLWSIPLAIGIGIFLAEYGRQRLATIVRFVSDVLVGVPSIVVGMFGYTLIVLRDGNFSALAGAFALGFIILPIVGRTTEESLRLVPGDLREAALALGVPRWKTTLRVVLPAASTGVVTGAMLGLSRVAGETAPLLFTALGNNFLNLDPTRPTAAMTLNIYSYALSPFDYLHEQAWAASFFLLVFVLLINILARRFAVRKGSR